jgi:hypothetical protein
MNLSALRQIASHWKEIRGALIFLREGTLRQSAAAPLSLWELRWAAAAGVVLPGYMLCHGGGMPESGRLDPLFSGTSKILFDVITVVDLLAEEALPRGELERLLGAPVDVDRFIWFAEERGAFIGPRGACAAPDSLVREALTLLVGPGLASRGSTEGIERALGGTSAFLRFAEAFFAMDIACCGYQFVASDLAQSLVEDLKGLSEEALGTLGRRVLGALELAIQALPDLDFVILPRERRRRVIELHEHYLRHLGLSSPGALVKATDFSPALEQLIQPVLVTAAQLEQLARRELPGLAREVRKALGWEEGEQPERRVQLERWLGIGVAQVLHQACDTDAAARPSGEAV